MKDVHFVHTSDWHLGFFQYNRKQRYFDFRNAVVSLLDKVIELQPDFMLHTGDIFHHARPTPGTLRQAVKILKRLDREGIPTYLIRGNHDGMGSQLLQRGGGVISLLRDLELVTFVDDVIIEVDDNVIIAGIGYYTGNKINKKLDDLLQLEPEFLESDRFKIVAIHGFVEGQLEDITQISLRQIEKLGVDYFAAGHYHIPWQHHEKRIYAPGSSEATSTNDWNRGDEIDHITLYHSFYEVKAESGSSWLEPEVETHRFTVRPKVSLNLQSTHDSTQELLHELRELADEKLKVIQNLEPSLSGIAPVLDINLSTKLPFEEYSKLKFSPDEFPGYLHILSTITGEEWTMSPHTQPHALLQSVEQVLHQEFENFGEHRDEFVDLTINLIDVLGELPASRSFADDIYENLISAFESVDSKKVREIIKVTGKKQKKLKSVKELEEDIVSEVDNETENNNENKSSEAKEASLDTYFDE